MKNKNLFNEIGFLLQNLVDDFQTEKSPKKKKKKKETFTSLTEIVEIKNSC